MLFLSVGKCLQKKLKRRIISSDHYTIEFLCRAKNRGIQRLVYAVIHECLSTAIVLSDKILLNVYLTNHQIKCIMRVVVGYYSEITIVEHSVKVN